MCRGLECQRNVNTAQSEVLVLEYAGTATMYSESIVIQKKPRRNVGEFLIKETQLCLHRLNSYRPS